MKRMLRCVDMGLSCRIAARIVGYFTRSDSLERDDAERRTAVDPQSPEKLDSRSAFDLRSPQLVI